MSTQLLGQTGYEIGFYESDKDALRRNLGGMMMTEIPNFGNAENSGIRDAYEAYVAAYMSGEGIQDIDFTAVFFVQDPAGIEKEKHDNFLMYSALEEVLISQERARHDQEHGAVVTDALVTDPTNTITLLRTTAAHPTGEVHTITYTSVPLGSETIY